MAYQPAETKAGRGDLRLGENSRVDQEGEDARHREQRLAFPDEHSGLQSGANAEYGGDGGILWDIFSDTRATGGLGSPTVQASAYSKTGMPFQFHHEYDK